MNELRQKWINALRDGKYIQCRGTLRKPEGYCCLGVLYEVIHGTEGWKGLHNCGWYKSYSHQYVDCTISEEDMRLVGLTEEETSDLQERNDNGQTFSQIADFIEKEL